jgi:hypothetical protein
MTSDIKKWSEMLCPESTCDSDRMSILSKLAKMSKSREHRINMASDEFDLLATLVDLVNGNTIFDKSNVFIILLNLSFEPANHQTMTGSEMGLLPALIGALRGSRSGLTISVCAIIKNLAFAEETKRYAALDGNELLPTLNSLLKQSLDQNDSELTYIICHVVEALTVGGSLCDAFASPKFIFLTALHDILISPPNGDLKMQHRVIVSLWNIAEHSTPYVAYELIRCNIHTTMVQILQVAGNNTANWATEIPSKALCFLMNICRHPFASAIIKRVPDIIVFMTEVSTSSRIDQHCPQSLKALFILVFMLGREENGLKTALLPLPAIVDVTNHVQLLIDIYSNTMQSKGGTGYELGAFCLRVIVSAISALAVSDSNKHLLTASPQLLLLLRDTLKLFVEGGPQIRLSGGGGNDTETAAVAVETILQLSFYYESDLDLQTLYMTSEVGLAGLLEMYVCSPHQAISLASQRTAMHLLARLRSSQARVSNASPHSQADAALVLPASRKHVMISYAWGCNKHLVIAFSHALRQMGIDVWRDEDGSSLLPAMVGSVDDCMARALELSHTVIICVSPEYKESANCRSEGKYANDLFKRGHLNIIYVMMNKQYHTGSVPEFVNGWLGLMVGDYLWYSLWDEVCVASTSSSVSALITGRDVPLSLPASPAPAAIPALTPDPDASADAFHSQQVERLQLAWELLNDVDRVQDTAAMQAFLGDIGNCYCALSFAYGHCNIYVRHQECE